MFFNLEIRCLDAFLALFLEALETPLDHAQVGEDQLVFHALRVAGGIHRTTRVGHGLVAEGADDVDEGVGIFVAGHVHQGSSAAAAGGDHVGELNGGRRSLLRIEDGREPIEARIGHFRDADGRLTLPPRRVFRARHQLEEGGLAGRREADQRSVQHEENLGSETAIVARDFHLFAWPLPVIVKILTHLRVVGETKA